MQKKAQKAPAEREQRRTFSLKEVDVAESVDMQMPLETFSAAMDEGSTSFTDDQDQTDVSDVDNITQLLQKITLLELKLANCEEKLVEVKNENEILLSRQFSLDKIEDDDSAILFYTGFPLYKALMSFYKYFEPKLEKMQY